MDFFQSLAELLRLRNPRELQSTVADQRRRGQHTVFLYSVGLLAHVDLLNIAWAVCVLSLAYYLVGQSLGLLALASAWSGEEEDGGHDVFSMCTGGASDYSGV